MFYYVCTRVVEIKCVCVWASACVRTRARERERIEREGDRERETERDREGGRESGRERGRVRGKKGRLLYDILQLCRMFVAPKFRPKEREREGESLRQSCEK